MFDFVLIYFKILPTNVSRIPESSNMISFNKTKSMIVSLPGKQYYNIFLIDKFWRIVHFLFIYFQLKPFVWQLIFNSFGLH